MMNSIIISCISLLFFLVSTLPANADLADELEHLVGYTVLDSKTVDGWVQNGKRHDDFEGCDHGRTIIFTDGTYLVCGEYSYMYAYRPTAVILGKELSYGGKQFYIFKMVVEDEIYDMNTR